MYRNLEHKYWLPFFVEAKSLEILSSCVCLFNCHKLSDRALENCSFRRATALFRVLRGSSRRALLANGSARNDSGNLIEPFLSRMAGS